MKTNRTQETATFADAMKTWIASIETAGFPDRLPSENIAIAEAVGRVPSQIARTKHPSPTYRAAAMDGYAVRSADVARATAQAPLRLHVGEDAVAIDTGGAIPDEFDCVIALERVKASGKNVVVSDPVPPGKNVRLPGEDVPPGVAVGWPGLQLRPVDCAALIASGCTTVEVVERPRLAIIPTGDEVVPAGTPPKPGTVVESNSLMIAAEARSLGAEVRVWPIAPDDDEAIETSLREAIGAAEVVVLLAGSSRGKRDRGAGAIERIGKIDVRGVATRPAKPVVLGHSGSVPVVNLPGFPVSCHFAFEAYVAPMLRRLGGLADPMPRRARLAQAQDTDGSADEWHSASLLTAPGSPRALVVPFAQIGGSLYRLAQADARFHLKRGVSAFPRHIAVSWNPMRDADAVARPMFVGPYDPLLEEMAALGGFRCRWTDDESGQALDEGLADAVGLLVRGDGLGTLRRRAGEGRKVLPIGVRHEGYAKRATGGPSPSASAGRSANVATQTSTDGDPWAGAAAVAAGILDRAPCSRYVAERYGLSFEDGQPALYVVIWEDRPGHRFPWGIVLGAALSALEDGALRLGWKSIGMPSEAATV
jgi:molybdenum cofactor synthesis domain-containing protein